MFRIQDAWYALFLFPILKKREMSVSTVSLSDQTTNAFHTFSFSFWLWGSSHSVISWIFFEASTLCWPSISQKSPLHIAGHISGVGILFSPWGMTTIVCMSFLNWPPKI